MPLSTLLPDQSVAIAVTCSLCPHHPPLPATPAGALFVAFDHALDTHRALLLTDPASVEAALTVSTAGGADAAR